MFLFDNFNCTTNYNDEIKHIINKQKWPESTIILSIKTKVFVGSKRLVKESITDCIRSNFYLYKYKYCSNFILSGFGAIDAHLSAKIIVQSKNKSILNDLKLLSPDIFKMSYQPPMLIFLLIAYIDEQRENGSNLDLSLFDAFSFAWKRC